VGCARLTCGQPPANAPFPQVTPKREDLTRGFNTIAGELTVSVTDSASGASFELPVAADEALAAFYHPYPYAAVKGVPY
jgi:hypothetical protein